MNHKIALQRYYCIIVTLVALFTLFWVAAQSPFIADLFSRLLTFFTGRHPGPDRAEKWLLLAYRMAMLSYLLLIIIIVFPPLYHAIKKREPLIISSYGLLFAITLALLVIKSFFVAYTLLRHFYSPWAYLMASPAWSAILVSLLLVAPSLFFQRSCKLYLVIINLLVSMFLFAFLSYIRTFDDFPTSLSITMAENLAGQKVSGGAANIAMMVKPWDLLLFADIAAIIYFYRFRRLHHTVTKRVAIITMALCLLALIVYYRDESSTLSKAQWQRKNGALGSFVYNEIKLFKQRNSQMTMKEQELVKRWYSQNQLYQQSGPLDGRLAGKNVIFIVIESLEAFPIGSTLDGLEITPTINQLLQNSLFFPNIYEQTTASTVHGLLAIQTSLYSPLYGIVTQRFPQNSYRQHSIASFFNNQGYSTMASLSSDGSTWKIADMMSSMGYQQLIYSGNGLKEGQSPQDLSLFGLSDKTFYRELLPYLNQMVSPSFSFLFTSSSHTPFVFDMGGSIDKPFLASSSNKNLTGYLNLVYYADQALNILLDNLKEQGRLDDTVVVITGDHTGLSKYFPSNYRDLERLQNPYGFNYVNRDLRVPFIIYNPSIEGRVIETIGGQVDLLPTLLPLIGLGNGQNLAGKNLLTTSKGFALLTNGHLVGDVTEDERKKIVEGRIITDLQLRTNYFNTN